MNFEKFTIKAQELIGSSQALAGQMNNQQIEPEHIMIAMLKEDQRLAASIFEKIGISTEILLKNLSDAVNTLPKVTGMSGQNIYISANAQKIRLFS